MLSFLCIWNRVIIRLDKHRIKYPILTMEVLKDMGNDTALIKWCLLLLLCLFCLSNEEREVKKMFEKLINKMNDYDKVMTKAYEEMEQQKKHAHSNYKGEKLMKKITNANQKYNDIRMYQQRIYDEFVRNEFDVLKNKVSDIVGEQVPSDFVSMLEALKINKYDISDYEAELYINKYKNNYTSCKAIINLLHEAKKMENQHVIYVDFVQKELKKCLEFALDYAYNYNHESLQTAIYLTERTNPILTHSNELESFFNKEFVTLEQI